MRNGIPKALIIGSDNFIAIKLADRLAQNDIHVLKDDPSEDIDYIFDFVGKPDFWDIGDKETVKVCVITIDNQDEAKRLEKELMGSDVNWRLVSAHGVYGVGMRRRGFLADAFILAAKNKNLILPSLTSKYRLLADDDLIEAIIRSSMLRGTDGQVFTVLGQETDTKEVAGVLIDKAKMTRLQVIQSELHVGGWDTNVVEENWKKLKWRPIKNFEDGAEATLQYFLTLVDEETRKQKMRQKEKKKITYRNSVSEAELEDRRNKVLKRFEVEIEEPIVAKTVLDEEEEIEPVIKRKLNSSFTVDKVIPSLNFEEIERQAEKEKVEEVIEEESEQVSSNNQTKLLDEKVTVVRQETRRRKSFNWVWWVVLAMIVFYLPTNLIIRGLRLKNDISKIGTLLLKQDFEKVKKIIPRAKQNVQRTEDLIDELSLNKIGVFANYQELLRVGEGVLDLSDKAVEVGRIANDFNEAIFHDKNISWPNQLILLQSLLTETESDIGILEARARGNLNWIPRRFREVIAKLLGKMSETRETIFKARKLIEILPELIGLDGKRRDFMVLFQNEMEIRASGGFLGSYGILSFEGGRLLNFEIKDIYEADGQLRGHVEPPVPIRDVLGEAAWFMRDANWQASFPAAVLDIQWFLEKSTNRKVDGIIGINLAVAKSILEVVGEITMIDYGEKINKNNLFEQAEFYAETKFFPGSGQKANFLSGLGRQLFEEIKNLNSEKQYKLLEALMLQFDKNELQMVLNNKESARVLAELGWDGAIYNGKCGTDRCEADYVYLVESNFGVNKANYFIYRGVEKAVDITNSSIKRVLKINYENIAKNTSWPGGDYKNYLRVYLPVGINLESVRIIDGNNLSKVEVVGGDKLNLAEYAGKTELGFLVKVPVLSKRIVEIKYSSNIELLGKEKFSYLNYFQKQSGAGDTGLVVLVSFPKNYQILQVEPLASMVGDKVLFNTKLDRDVRLGVEIGK
jgi:hypothetical protein